jgi:hypothetical protein
MQRRNHSKNIYRQFDPASLHTLTSQPDARVTSVTTSPLSHEYAIIYFDQVITANNSPTVAPLWTIGSQTLVAFIELAADGKSLLTQWSGAIDVGDTVTMGDMATNWGFNTTLGGTFIDYSGTVAALPIAATFDIVSITCADASTLRVEFDAPVAQVITSATHAQFSNWIVGTSAIVDTMQTPTSDRIVNLATNSSVTSGLAFNIPASSTQFISLTAATMAAKTGTT